MSRCRPAAHIGESAQVSVAVGLIFPLGRGGILHVSKAQAVARDFVCVCGTDSFACGADFRVAFGFLPGSVEQAVGRKNQVGFSRKLQHLLQIHARCLKGFGLFTEQHRVEHHSVAYKVCLAALENSGGY